MAQVANDIPLQDYAVQDSGIEETKNIGRLEEGLPSYSLNNVFDIKTSKRAEVTPIRVKLLDEEKEAVSVLLEVYAKTYGVELTLTELLGILVKKELQNALSSFLPTQANIGFPSLRSLGGGSSHE